MLRNVDIFGEPQASTIECHRVEGKNWICSSACVSFRIVLMLLYRNFELVFAIDTKYVTVMVTMI